MMRLLTSLLMISLLTGCEQAKEQTSEPVVPAVKYKTISEVSTGQVREISGIVTASDNTRLSFQVAGTVEEVLVDIGDQVREGQILATLDRKDYQLSLQSAQAQMRNARAVLNEKNDDYQRKKSLKAKGYISATALDQARTALAAARSEVDVASSALKNAELDLQRTVLKAPFAGRVASREIDPFSDVSAGQALFEISGKDALKVKVLLPETLIRNVSYGQTVTVSFPTLPDVTINGTVSEIGSRVETGNAFPVKIALLEQHKDLLNGITAKARFLFDDYLGDKPVFLIPLSAVDLRGAMGQKQPQRNDQAPVFLFDEETGTAKRTMVKIGDIRHNQIEVYEGLTQGDQLIVAGVAFLQDGQTVQLWNP